MRYTDTIESTAAEREIRRRIERQGRITFAEFMRLALYHPIDGYYARGPAFGAAGDYYTSPAAHPAFGTLLCAQLCRMWQLMDEPPQFTVVEMGAGDGLLAEGITACAPSLCEGFARSLRYIALERYAPAVKPSAAEWLCAADIPLRGVKGCFISNELVDAFPVHRFRMRDGEPLEVFVALDNGAFVETLDTPSTTLIAAHIEALGFLPPDGSCGELNADATDWLAKVSDALAAGFVMTIDYGDTAAALHSRMPRGSVQTYYRHTEGSSPYQRIGRQDISAHVDFSLLQRAGVDVGLQTVAYATQSDLLRGLGFDELMEQMRSQTLSRRERQANIGAMRGLVNPDGLGRFKALIQRKAGNGWMGVSDGVEIAPTAALRNALPLPLLSERHMRLTDGLYPHTAFEMPSMWGDTPGAASSS